MRPYYEHGGVTIYHGDALAVLASLCAPIDLLLTDPPYSSGGAFRGDRTSPTTMKYQSSDSKTEIAARRLSQEVLPLSCATEGESW